MSDKPKIYLGVDIGIDGGLGWVFADSMTGCSYEMPVIGKKGKGKRAYDINGIFEIINLYHQKFIISAVIEDVTFMPTWNKHTLGLQYGCLYTFMGIFAALGIAYQVKQAKTWQKKIFEGMPKQDTKVMSALFCKRRFPNQVFEIGKRKIPHSGLTDSLCIAEYCRSLTFPQEPND